MDNNFPKETDFYSLKSLPPDPNINDTLTFSDFVLGNISECLSLPKIFLGFFPKFLRYSCS